VRPRAAALGAAALVVGAVALTVALRGIAPPPPEPPPTAPAPALPSLLYPPPVVPQGGVLALGAGPEAPRIAVSPTDALASEPLFPLVPGPGALPALTDVPREAAGAATWLADQDEVIGVAVGDEACAYPVSTLNYHYAAQDRLGGEAIVVCADPLSGAAAAFRATMASGPIRLAALGYAHRGAALLYDQRTGSPFSVVTGTFLAGPLSGQALEQLPARRTRWAAWREAQPETQVMSRRTGFDRPYDVDPFAHMVAADGRTVDARAATEVIVAPRTFDRAMRLRPKEWVLGLQLDGRPLCIPLGRGPGTQTVTAGGTTLTVTRGADPWDATVLDQAGRPVLPQTACYYFAWYAAFPGTMIWQEGPSTR